MGLCPGITYDPDTRSRQISTLRENRFFDAPSPRFPERRSPDCGAALREGASKNLRALAEEKLERSFGRNI